MLFSGNIIRQPVFDEMRKSGEGYRVVGNLSATDHVMNNSFWIGVYPGMTDEMLEYMAKTIIETVK
jgi:CDP-6-deoxy-D-xylo-4-hexulose-3-dehydrase